MHKFWFDRLRFNTYQLPKRRICLILTEKKRAHDLNSSPSPFSNRYEIFNRYEFRIMDSGISSLLKNGFDHRSAPKSNSGGSERSPLKVPFIIGAFCSTALFGTCFLFWLCREFWCARNTDVIGEFCWIEKVLLAGLHRAKQLFVIWLFRSFMISALFSSTK